MTAVEQPEIRNGGTTRTSWPRPETLFISDLHLTADRPETSPGA